ncbi:MAG: outer membrane protein assembly factor BamC [Gammaproteobacteria bacterium]|nr:outer membrane protein assembly factor BamC [Gammaproteobacteria bacterium]
MSPATPFRILSTASAVVALLLLSACDSVPKLGGVVKDKSAEYKSSRSEPRLEVPPDLSSSTIRDSMVVPNAGATFSEFSDEQGRPGAGDEVLVVPEGVEVARDGDKRWLVLEGPPANYWNRVRDFWLEQGLLIQMDNPAIGIMETDWAENRADIPSDFIRNTIGKVFDSLYSAATRDKFRTRFERGSEPNTTEVYITHRGAEEKVQGDSTLWQPRPSDPELEAEMLHRLVVFLGVNEQRADRMIAQTREREPRASLERRGDGDVALVVKDRFSRAWRRTGLALDRVGFTVQDRDRSRGLYFVRYVDPLATGSDDVSLLSKLNFWSDDEDDRKVEYLISLQEQEATTDVIILDKEGQVERSETANRILSLLHEQLR